MKISYCIWFAGKWVDAEGELLPDIAPHLASVATWAIGKVPDGLWAVTNLESGYTVRRSFETKCGTIATAQKILSEKTCHEVSLAIKEALKGKE